MNIGKIICKSFLTLRYGFHDVQEAHEQAAGFCLVQLVTARSIAYQGLRPSKLRTNIQKEIQSKIYFKYHVATTVEYTSHVLSIYLCEFVGFSKLEGNLDIMSVL